MRLRNVQLPIILGILKGFSSDDVNSERLWKEKLLPKIPAALKDSTEERSTVLSVPSHGAELWRQYIRIATTSSRQRITHGGGSDGGSAK